MAFFKFRLPGQTPTEPAGAASATESVETLRRRARHRLIGASVLVLLGVIGFPLLFDTQPRPISADIRVEIPKRDQTPALGTSANAPVPAASALDAREEVVDNNAKSQAKGDIKPVETKPTEAKPSEAVSTAKPAETKAEAKPEPKAETKAAEVKPAEVKPEDKPAADAAPRFIVQVGSFADEAKAREARQKLEKAGIKTYTHVAETKEGKRTRVRVGPFSTREEADKAAQKIKQLQFQPQIQSL